MSDRQDRTLGPIEFTFRPFGTIERTIVWFVCDGIECDLCQRFGLELTIIELANDKYRAVCRDCLDYWGRLIDE